jgi:predicted ArsR family transcriptional regulator
MEVEQVAQAVGIRPNTARGHLEVLMAQGRVRRTSRQGRGRGRPRWLYSADSPPPSPYEVLARTLAQHVTGGPQPPEVLAAEWLERIPVLPPATTPDEAVDHAVQALTALGFTAEVNTVGDAIAMRNCPFADLVDEFPLICDIHGAMLATVLQQADQSVDVARLDVWARDGVCVAHLRRPDLKPARTIDGRDLATTHLTEGP